MGKIGRKIKKGLKKVGRAMGGPVTGAVDAVRAADEGKGAKGAAKAFTRSLRPGQGVEAMHDAHVEVAEAAAEKAGKNAVAGRIRTLGRITKPTTPLPDPTEAIETSGSALRAATAGNWRRAGRSMAGGAASAAMGPVTDPLNKGQAVGDLFDEPSQALDDSLRPYLRRIFGKSLDFDEAEINPGRPGPGTGTDATTFPKVIYLGGRSQFLLDATGAPTTIALPSGDSVNLPDDVLVHELVHFWQNKHGGSRYLMEAVGGYVAHGQDDSYRWWNFTDANRSSRIDNFTANHGAEWRDMPVEAQAEFIQNAYQMGAFNTGAAPGYAGLRIRSGDFADSNDSSDYAAAFGAGVGIDWTNLLRGAVEALHDEDFRR